MTQAEANDFISRNYNKLRKIAASKTHADCDDLLHESLLLWLKYYPKNSKIKNDDEFCKYFNTFMRKQFECPKSAFNKKKMKTQDISPEQFEKRITELEDLHVEYTLDLLLEIINKLKLDRYKKYFLRELCKELYAGGNVHKYTKELQIPFAAVYNDKRFLIRNLKLHLLNI